tara:strand:+ start:142 stop:513 length:372 start_codon:yes stop_codon:yes gene_type:complete
MFYSNGIMWYDAKVNNSYMKGYIMQLMTKEIEKSLPPLGTFSETLSADIPIAFKMFTPWSNWTWYVTEGRKEKNGDFLLYGMVHGLEKECGSFMLSELKEITGPMGLTIERDRGFTGTLNQVE